MATLQTVKPIEQVSKRPSEIEVPASTPWPMVLAFGFTLMFAGLLTSVSVSVLGAVLTVAGCAGWFREVLPRQHEVVLPVILEDRSVGDERARTEGVIHQSPPLQRIWSSTRQEPRRFLAFVPKKPA